MKEKKKTEEEYSDYLSSLGHSQLEVEVNYLLDEYTKITECGLDIFTKGRLVLKELGAKTSGGVKEKIKSMAEDLRNLIH